MQNDGSHDFLKAYPKLHDTCIRVINERGADMELKSNAYVVASFLRGQTSPYEMGGKAMDDLKKALRLNPGDWRLYGMEATRNMDA